MGYLNNYISYKKSLMVYNYALLTRYIPGKIWPIVGLMYFSDNKNEKTNSR